MEKSCEEGVGLAFIEGKLGFFSPKNLKKVVKWLLVRCLEQTLDLIKVETLGMMRAKELHNRPPPNDPVENIKANTFSGMFGGFLD